DRKTQDGDDQARTGEQPTGGSPDQHSHGEHRGDGEQRYRDQLTQQFGSLAFARGLALATDKGSEGACQQPPKGVEDADRGDVAQHDKVDTRYELMQLRMEQVKKH